MIIRPLETLAEYHAAEELEQAVWGHGERDVVPYHVTLTAQKNGGLVLGAFDTAHNPPTLVGFTFGFVGRTSDGILKHCSHQLGVLPAYRDQNVGYRLKLAQREFVLRQGIQLMTWTYDPLESRNANLNLHKLGAVCNTYLRDLYGSMEDGLNAGLPSDRFQVDWHLSSQHVTARLAGTAPAPGVAALLAAGVPLLNPAPAADPEAPASTCESLAGQQVLLRFPANMQQIKASRPELALPWRLQLRELCEAAFAAGYTVVDMLAEAGLSCYLLKQPL
ncbi:MAG: hypothetical protein MUD01_20970 [Chloroflexaceae bacterium]|jgi:predicted GNAT superfamily acetyltransferase|nr:hypothetical protein [Chloroflexaceae bacterium]